MLGYHASAGDLSNIKLPVLMHRMQGWQKAYKDQAKFEAAINGATLKG